jgi:hypothetical protein
MCRVILCSVLSMHPPQIGQHCDLDPVTLKNYLQVDLKNMYNVAIFFTYKLRQNSVCKISQNFATFIIIFSKFAK